MFLIAFETDDKKKMKIKGLKIFKNSQGIKQQIHFVTNHGCIEDYQISPPSQIQPATSK